MDNCGEHPDMKKNESHPLPVLMIPLRRCGSHALRLRLNKNSEFYAPFPLDIVDFMPLLELYGNLSDDNNYFQLITDVIGLQAGLMVKWPDISLDPVEMFEKIKNEPRSIHRIMWEMLFEVGRKQKASVVMDNSLDSVYYTDELLGLFPEMKFLNVVRDPRAQIASMNKAIIHDFDTMLNTETWINACDKANELMVQHPGKVLTIRFEDFVSNETEAIQTICDFFAIEFTDNMLDIKHSQEAKSISTRSALWVSNSSAPIPANVDKFKKSLTDEDIEIIETMAGDYMDFYGYERMTKGNADVSADAFVRADKRNYVNKEKAWNELKTTDPRDYMLRKHRVDYLEMVKARLLGENDIYQKTA